jgi:GntR family transcriptional regulator/MocR family aminotransferase
MGVRVNPLGLYRVVTQDSTAEPLPPALVLGFGNIDEHQIRNGIRRIAQAAQT